MNPFKRECRILAQRESNEVTLAKLQAMGVGEDTLGYLDQYMDRELKFEETKIMLDLFRKHDKQWVKRCLALQQLMQSHIGRRCSAKKNKCFSDTRRK